MSERNKTGLVKRNTECRRVSVMKEYYGQCVIISEEELKFLDSIYEECDDFSTTIERINLIKNCASGYKRYVSGENDRAFSFKKTSSYLFQVGLSKLKSQNIEGVTTLCGRLKIKFENNCEKLLFLMFLVDPQLTYLSLFKNKREQGEDDVQIANILKSYYGFFSATLLKVENSYRQLLKKLFDLSRSRVKKENK